MVVAWMLMYHLQFRLDWLDRLFHLLLAELPGILLEAVLRQRLVRELQLHHVHHHQNAHHRHADRRLLPRPAIADRRACCWWRFPTRRRLGRATEPPEVVAVAVDFPFFYFDSVFNVCLFWPPEYLVVADSKIDSEILVHFSH